MFEKTYCMKTTALTLLLLLSFGTHAQELKEDRVDDFTKTSVKRTSWELAIQTTKLQVALRASKLDSLVYLNVRMLRWPDKVFAISEGADIMFLMDNDSVVTVQNLKMAISCKGCGARGLNGSGIEGTETNYALDETKLRLLVKHPLKKIRVYTSAGYLEDEVKEKRADILQKLLQLL